MRWCVYNVVVLTCGDGVTLADESTHIHHVLTVLIVCPFLSIGHWWLGTTSCHSPHSHAILYTCRYFIFLCQFHSGWKESKYSAFHWGRMWTLYIVHTTAFFSGGTVLFLLQRPGAGELHGTVKVGKGGNCNVSEG